jgi:hypothetical protein
MKVRQLMVLALGAAALLFATPPAQAQQVWVGPANQVMLAPSWQVAPAWRVAPAWQVAPTWGARRYYRQLRRAEWYGTVRGPRAGVVVAGRRW